MSMKLKMREELVRMAGLSTVRINGGEVVEDDGQESIWLSNATSDHGGTKQRARERGTSSSPWGKVPSEKTTRLGTAVPSERSQRTSMFWVSEPQLAEIMGLYSKWLGWRYRVAMSLRTYRLEIDTDVVYDVKVGEFLIMPGEFRHVPLPGWSTEMKVVQSLYRLVYTLSHTKTGL
ncbi:hypothetical protein FISHEDRAFT_60262 [Fistulina hepatica ATCC 64428]|uniref:Uncharacterized protein n=1 Tax=Fistulina hepatica ATCC 64428 TaxID=1128425 RepID=A0A0D7A6D2_9AGAR|nr:hypothetical protein FISHEDRAFT_60262 [Fistulina hepatica ATCC 64428]